MTTAAGSETPNPRVPFFGRYRTQQVVLTIITLGVWLLVPLTIWLWRTGRRRGAAASGGVLGLLVIAVAIAAATGGNTSPTSTAGSNAGAGATQPSTTPKPHLTAAQQLAQYCHQFATSALTDRPTKCLTAKQQARVKALLAQQRARERAQAQAAAARIAAANAWHKGYFGPIETDNGAVYAKWVDASCADYAINGCWKLQVTTEAGCSSLYVEANELQGGTIVGNAIASQDNIPAKTPVLLELDADTSARITASAPKITCYP